MNEEQPLSVAHSITSPGNSHRSNAALYSPSPSSSPSSPSSSPSSSPPADVDFPPARRLTSALVPRTHRTWSREQALTFGAKGREKLRANRALHRSKRQRFIQVALDPPSSLPAILAEQIAGAVLHIDKQLKAGHPGRVVHWLDTLERLVALQAKLTKNTNGAKSATKAQVQPGSTRAPSLAATSSSPPAEAAPPVPAAPASSEDLEPLQPEPID